MNIEYLNNLEENSEIGNRKIKGVSKSEITNVEQKLNIAFPKSYKEFLFLTGESCGALPLLESADLKTLSSDFYKEVLEEDMKDTDTVIERPFWVFADSIGDQGFWFFYLDEESEDPQTHYYAYKATEPYEAIIGSHELIFSEFIDGRIDFGNQIEKEGIW